MLEWFMAKMKREFGVEVRLEEVGYEAYTFDHEEIDELLIPDEHVAKLPNPLLLEAFMYADAEGNEWIAGVVVEEETREMLYEVWIKNGKRICARLYVS
ncbi:hypothetical protein GGR02_003519 [Anoxybacillus voinovskiensis]|uniref:Uncharacterized protein n=1 Tax=Anoxybacteroides voinovskiense TaxID=230470 RepID=A0A840DVR7_9BACL|nr:hypothetical protein [Anoxybacillus voinovskiensis]MBB4075665.1 hypothetical protein [Anoxybacillus voinovskiensis]GGJ80855.1 hypothetical protein GCM10008982_32990 [Anoxybacillus voinovskiensis]